MELADILARVRHTAPAAPAPPEHEQGPAGLNPVLIAVAAFAVGILLACIVDWRGHAHPRD